MFNPKTFTTGRPMNLRITYPKHKVMDYLVREDFRKMPSKSAPFNVMQYCELKDDLQVSEIKKPLEDC
jgi:hypothetical protein